ncbi:MAG: hypothetical protein ACOZAN_04735 [Patescibacteria group bacterium]
MSYERGSGMVMRIDGITEGIGDRIPAMPFHKGAKKRAWLDFKKLDLKDKLKKISFIHLSRPFTRLTAK